MKKRNVSDGFRRILYDAMVLSSPLRVIRQFPHYHRETAKDVDGYVEGHHMNALIQIRSMVDFLCCLGNTYPDTMTAVQFFGSSKQTAPKEIGKHAKDNYRKVANKYTAHKSWDAVAKDATAGARQHRKPEVVRIGLDVLRGFEKFWKECEDNNLGITLNEYARQYKRMFEENMEYLKRIGP